MKAAFTRSHLECCHVFNPDLRFPDVFLHIISYIIPENVRSDTESLYLVEESTFPLDRGGLTLSPMKKEWFAS